MSKNAALDLTKAWSQRNTSQHTQRAYSRWIDRFLVDLAGMPATGGEIRRHRMSQLPWRRILPLLLAADLEAWLGSLAEQGHSRQSLDQARAAVISLSELMAAEGLISAELFAKLKAVSAPALAIKKPQRVILAPRQLGALIHSAGSHSASRNQTLRNTVVMMMLCMMALRRDELSAAKWGDIQARGGRVFLHIRGGRGRVEMPRSLLKALTNWRQAIGAPGGETPLVRRIWKGGRIASAGLSSDGIWLIVKAAAQSADLGAVSPDDLRRSVVAGLRDAGYSTEAISKLLRHKNRRITARYLKQIPKRQSDEP